MKKIQVIGPGCPKCKQLMSNAEAACRGLAFECEVEKVSDMGKIMEFGVMTVPAFAIDGQVKSVGKVLTQEEIIKLLSE